MKTLNFSKVFTALLLGWMVSSALFAQVGKDAYTKTCSVCHAAGIAGAPRYGNSGDWEPRLGGGVARLYESALKGTPKGMPAKGGNLSLPDSTVKAAVDYMVSPVVGAAKSADVAKDSKPEGKAKQTKPESKTDVSSAKVDAKPSDSKPAAAPLPAAAAPASLVQSAPAASDPVSAAGPAPAAVSVEVNPGDVNSFNRLLKPVGKRNLPPPEDGIHDPANDGTFALQPPLAAYGSLPKSFAGNRINWVQAIDQKKISPRADRIDPRAEMIVMDLNVVREVKGTMPDVVYPHKQHTEWLDCSNCHPAIFTPQKGANAISMAAILLGEKCGVCHGKVAFPVSECRLCHSKKKEPVAPRAEAGK